ncbi:MAG: SDR family NAD(P)-dependent oxidoreductase [Candidatus Kapabacteria bacterium]|nr:SDR family NAD(P)-dependent oxidoreductase [Candidatus Kapabacteria bacterium]
MNLKGKVALITGANAGIGNAILTKLAELGCNISFVDIAHNELTENTIKRVEALGLKCRFFQSDVSNFQDAEIIIQKIISEFGKIDILVNNAGINKDSVIWKMTEEQWDSVIDVNLKGYFNYVRAVAPLFKDQCNGKIVNITSINGLRGKFGQSNYSAAKAGIIGFTKALAKELGKYSINVNAVAPGMINTDMMKNIPEAARTAALQETVLNRIGSPEDIANAVAFLCSDLSKHITGEIIKVDGGQYI